MPTMPPTKRVDAEAKVPGLTELLREWRDDDVPFAEIAFRLRTQHEVAVTGETVRAWCGDLSEPDTAA